MSAVTKLSDIFWNRMDFEKKTLELEVDYQEIIINFEYKIKGKILVLPVQGEGPGRLILSTTFSFSHHIYNSLK
jgi:hypothetical protein